MCQAKVLYPAPGAPSIKMTLIWLNRFSSSTGHFLFMMSSTLLLSVSWTSFSSIGPRWIVSCPSIAKLKTWQVGGGGHRRVKNEGSSVQYLPPRYSAYELRIHCLLLASTKAEWSFLLSKFNEFTSSHYEYRHTSQWKLTVYNILLL